MTTLNELFPGESGRLLQIRVMLRLALPELRYYPRDRPLDESVAARLHEALLRMGRARR